MDLLNLHLSHQAYIQQFRKILQNFAFPLTFKKVNFQQVVRLQSARSSET